MSEAFINSMFLALSGGFQDAYIAIAEMKYSQMPRQKRCADEPELSGNFTAGLRYLDSFCR